MIELGLVDKALILRVEGDVLRPRHESQLAYWGFQYNPQDGAFTLIDEDIPRIATRVAGYFQRQNLPIRLDDQIQKLLAEQQCAETALTNALQRGAAIKNAEISTSLSAGFLEFIQSGLARPLKHHQTKAALHLLHAENGANFSVPGSGKTSVVLAAYAWLKHCDKVDSLFVVGPPACFAPWKAEFASVLGRSPKCETLAGGDLDERRGKYLANRTDVAELYLTTFQTLHRDWAHVSRLLGQRGARFFLVVDEAHYIKQLDGVWATATLAIARHAAYRCVLSGTPFPRSYVDAFNLFDVLWPNSSPISSDQRHRIEMHIQRKQFETAADTLGASIGPLFYRVRKSDLNLAPQIFHDAIQVTMNPHERRIYDSILDRIYHASQEDFFRDFELLGRLRRGRMIRLRQCVSYAALLNTAVEHYSENLADNPTMSDIIRHYDSVETPAKLDALRTLISSLRAENHRVVVWSNFVRTLKLIEDTLRADGHGVALIYGGTPFETTDLADEMSREQIIRQFTDQASTIDVLVANPAACAESISLHKSCSHAVYYDLSYNCAQYLQSLDRIHRVGGSEHTPAHYYFLEYANSIDSDIISNLRRKARNMSALIDQEFPIYSLDMFADDDDLEAYERLFAGSARQL